jgi:hypothetical protein
VWRVAFIKIASIRAEDREMWPHAPSDDSQAETDGVMFEVKHVHTF